MIRLTLKWFYISIFIFIFTTLFIFWLSTSPERCVSESPLYQTHIAGHTHHLAVIVPFRERFNQLLQFIPHMHSFLSRQNISHDFYIVNQVDKYRFNRGCLINIGYMLSRNRSTYMVMHDVDLLPLNDQLSYRFPSHGLLHLSAPSLHPNYHYDTYVGGILLIQNRHFERVNGFSTNYWGWGLEDDEFYTRLKEANLKIYRPENITTGANDTFLHVHDRNVHRRDTAKLFNQNQVTRKKDRITGLNSTRFKLRQSHGMTLEGVPFRVFDVELHCDHSRTPWCQPVFHPTATNAQRKKQSRSVSQ